VAKKLDELKGRARRLVGQGSSTVTAELPEILAELIEELEGALAAPVRARRSSSRRKSRT